MISYSYNQTALRSRFSFEFDRSTCKNNKKENLENNYFLKQKNLIRIVSAVWVLQCHRHTNRYTRKTYDTLYSSIISILYY